MSRMKVLEEIIGNKKNEYLEVREEETPRVR